MKPWKIRKFAEDVVYDLRNKGLLPVVVLLLIAMVAVPVLISRGGSGGAPPPGGAASSQGAALAPENQAAVLAYNPGLRQYKQRLDGLSPKDPFRQQFAQSAAKAGQLTTTGASASTAGVTTTATTVSGGSTSTSTTTVTTGGPTKKKKKKKKATYIYKTDVLMGESSATLTPFNNVAPFTSLPTQEAPVVVYFGNTADNAMAMFLVSNRVSQLTGPGNCVPAPDDCSLLYLAPQQSEDLAYSVDGKTYRVQVAAIRRTAK
jgi:hypothetical protein